MCALINYGQLVGQVSGKVGTAVFARNKGGPYVRQTGMPVERFRNNLPRGRAIFGWLSRMYRALTPQEVGAWIAWAEAHPVTNRLGNSIVLSAIAAHQKLNNLAVRFGDEADYSTTPPVLDMPFSIMDLTAAAGAGVEGDIDLAWTILNTGDAGDYIQVDMTPPFASDKRDLPMKFYRFLETTTGILEVLVVSDLLPGFQYYFRARYVGVDGQTSAWQFASATPKEGV